MCGIAGRFSATSLPLDVGWVKRANDLLAHRGPDGCGRFSDEQCDLVHRRLSIIDVSDTGSQPMANEDGQILVIFNGEIYNHVELRAELKSKGHRFRGTSDTEVLVHLYEEREDSMVEALLGMFAFAIYDRRKRRLFLARDRFGIKPLYFTCLQDQIIFASEIKAIRTASAFSPILDRQAIYDYLSLSYVPEPFTGFANVQSLERGSTLTFDTSGIRQTTPLPTSATPQVSLLAEDSLERIEESLLQSVKRQSVADVQVAAFLSGGIDSSLIVSAYSRVSEHKLQTLNVRFPDSAYDETPVALSVARRCDTAHRTIELDRKCLEPEAVLELLLHFDQPFADSSLIPTYYVSQAVRDLGLKCTLSGDGGDEVFGGYPSFGRIRLLRALMTLPGPILGGVAATANRLAPMTQNFGRSVRRAACAANAGRLNSSHLFAELASYITDSQKKLLVPSAANMGLMSVSRHFGNLEAKPVRNLECLSKQLTETYLSVVLPSDMLKKVDMMSMRAGIEVRVPMLDEGLSRIGLSIPQRLKWNRRKGKVLLRELAKKWLPPDVSSHPKHGFSIPLDAMVTSRFHGMLFDVLLGNSSRVREFLDMRIVSNWLHTFRRAGTETVGGPISRSGLYQRLMIVLSLEIWLQENRLSW